MKKIVAFLMTLILGLSCAVSAFAADDASSGDWLYTVRDGEAVVTGYSGSDTTVAVPTTLGGPRFLPPSAKSAGGRFTALQNSAR